MNGEWKVIDGEDQAFGSLATWYFRGMMTIGTCRERLLALTYGNQVNSVGTQGKQM
jgi:hypothetical protein